MEARVPSHPVRGLTELSSLKGDRDRAHALTTTPPHQCARISNSTYFLLYFYFYFYFLLCRVGERPREYEHNAAQTLVSGSPEQKISENTQSRIFSGSGEARPAARLRILCEA